MPDAWSGEIEQRRPDIASLAAELHAADQKALLARRHAVPDVTVRLGYTYDSFEVSGNQRQSLAAGVQIPLPVADRGQAELEAASAEMLRAQSTRSSLIESGRLALEAAGRQRALTASRIAQMQAALEKADALRNEIQAASRQGGTSQVDVLLARRHYQELLLDGNDLEAEAYDDVLKIRRTAAIFPRPDAHR
jgi:outer membrane protein TolC